MSLPIWASPSQLSTDGFPHKRRNQELSGQYCPFSVLTPECTKELLLPDPGAGLDLGREPSETIRSAGKSFMYTPAYVGGQIEGIHGLFEACNSISSMRYEGAEGIGKMLVARRGHPNIKIDLAFSSSVQISDHRAVRKILEMSSDEVSLLTDSYYIYGLGSQVGQYDYGKEDLFLVNFTRHYTWELFHAGHLMMQVSYGQPQLPRRRLDEEKFRRDLPRIFPSIDRQHTDDLWQLVLAAIQQKHGTMVVIASNAESEAARLEKQCIRLEPTRLRPDMMRLVTAIDGTVLIDAQTNCFAIGVILDGIASEKGTSARGARYNSAIRYVDGKAECLAIVVSEDGSIDLIPDLKPQIPYSLVESYVNALREIKSASSSSYDSKAFNAAMSNLKAISFYLSPTVCKEVNQLRREIEAMRPVEGGAIHIIHGDFQPHEDLNDTYFL